MTEVRIRTPRTLLLAITAALCFLVGGSTAGVAQVGPPATTTTIAAKPTTTVPPTTAPPTTVTPTTAPETKLIPVPLNTIVDPAKPGPATTTTSSTVPPASLSAGQAEMFVRDQARTAASTTAALIEALRPLQNLGLTAQEALTLGMGQFPMLGLATWNDDWLDYRAGPPVHAHQGTDIFAAFDVPVRSPVDGTVRFEDSGLGGKGVFVTAPDGTYYYMAHLNSFHPGLANGSTVTQRQIVGYNGDSGNARGGAPHVHFEIRPGGGAAVNPKPFLDAWLQQAVDQAPALIASFQPAQGAGETIDGGVPQILMTTGLTRRFSAPALTVPHRERPAEDFNRAVLGPLTPTVLAPLLNP